LTHRPRTLVLVSGFILLALASVPSVQAVTTSEVFTEDFERCDNFDVADTGDCATDAYSVSTGGTGSPAVISTPAVGNHSYKFKATSTDYRQTFNRAASTSYGMCGLTFDLRLEDLPTGILDVGYTAGAISLPFTTNNLGDWAKFRVASTGVVTASAQGNGVGPVSATLLTIVPDTWYTFQIACTANTALAMREMTTASQVVLSSLSSTTQDLSDKFATVQTSSEAAYLDNIYFPGTPTPVPGAVFCAAPLETDFGYNYVNGPVEYQEDIDTLGGSERIEEGFVFEGDENFAEWGVLAKQLNPGTMAGHVEFRIEAHQDNDDSVFRASFGLETGGNLDPDASGDVALGNGLTTGAFADHIEIELTEDGDHWVGRFYYREATLNSGARTQLGQSFRVNADPNEAITFDFWFDSRSTATIPSDYSFGAAGGAGRVGPYAMLSSPDFSTGNGDPLILAYRSLEFEIDGGGGAATKTAFLDDDILDVWLIGYGTSGTLTNAETSLDDPETDHNSTCIYDDIGTARVVGSSGQDEQFVATFTGTTSPTIDDPVGEGTIFGGMVASASNLFGGNTVIGGILVSILLIIGFAVIGYGALGGSSVGGGVGAVLGLILSLAVGIFPLWPIVVIVILALAFMVFKLRG
jgi:hypothetical protein